MSHITLIRHGQANSHATSEEEYDRLSTLGQQQSAWLGEHLRVSGQHHVRLFTGTLNRHAATADAMATGMNATADERLNELQYFTLSMAFENEHGVKAPTSPDGFAAHLPLVFQAWADGKLSGAPETFQHFEERVTDVIHDIADGDGAALVVTSGGLISMVMRRVLDLDIPSMTQLTLAIMNTSVHRLFPIGGRLTPVMFNAIPHLEHPDRHHAQTHV